MSDAGQTADETKSPQERIAELERENQILHSRLDAMMGQLDRLTELVIGDDQIAESDITGKCIEERIKQNRLDVESALGFARTEVADDGPTTKKRLAKELSRDEIIVETVIRTQSENGSIFVDTVRDMAKPDARLEHRTVLDAWNELASEWDCFEIEDQETGPIDQKRLLCNKELLPTQLVRVVAESLSDEESTENLNSWCEYGGVR